MLNFKLGWLFVMFSAILIPCALLREQVVGGKSSETAPEVQSNWWTLSDVDFVNQYANLATGSQQDQSRFAWMAFARANQQVPFGENQQKFSQWELWASDLDTFSPNVPRFEAAKKIRPRPHLQPLQQLRLFSHRMNLAAANPFPQAGQEVTRNPLSYTYIMDNHLNTQQGIATYLGQPGNKIEFPLGVVETKAWWVRGALAGAHQLGGFSLTGLHLMVKVKPSPQNPLRTIAQAGFDDVRAEIEPGTSRRSETNQLSRRDSSSDAAKLMTDAGLVTAFLNYVSNGQQTQFGDSQFRTSSLEYTTRVAICHSPEPKPGDLDRLVIFMPLLSRSGIGADPGRWNESL